MEIRAGYQPMGHGKGVDLKTHYKLGRHNNNSSETLPQMKEDLIFCY